MIANRFIVVITLMVLFCGHTIAVNASIEDQTSALATVKIRLVNNRVVVRVPVGTHELNMVLDTGATSSALFQSQDQDFSDIEKIGTSAILFPALNETVTGSRLAPVPIKFGDVAYVPEKLLLIHQRPPIGDRLNFRFNGLLGQDFFSKFTVEIDPNSETLTLHKKGTDLRRKFTTRIPLRLRNKAPYILFENKLPWEHRETQKSLLLDTGFPGLMIIWNARHFSLAAGSSNVAAYQAENKGIFTHATFKIGKIKFHNAPVFLASNIPLQAQKRDGLLGANVLSQFHHVIDFTNENLMIQASRIALHVLDGELYVPNNESHVYKRYTSNEVGSKFVLE